MKEQLSKPLQYFYVVPASLSFIVFIFSPVIMFFNTTNSFSIWTIVFFIVMFSSLILLIGKTIADEQMKKFRHGINPLYLSNKYPGNLDSQVNDLIAQKYDVKSKTATTAHLEKKPYFSIVTAIVLFMLGVFPGVVYLVWYFVQKSDVVLLDISTQKK